MVDRLLLRGYITKEQHASIMMGVDNALESMYKNLDSDVANMNCGDYYEYMTAEQEGVELKADTVVATGSNTAGELVPVIEEKDSAVLPDWEGKPYNVVKRGGKYCVVKEGGGDSLGCHSTRAEALNQMRAVYANEGKKEEFEAYVKELIGDFAEQTVDEKQTVTGFDWDSVEMEQLMQKARI
jgi:hypothetical protein